MFPCGHIHIADDENDNGSNIGGVMAWVFDRCQLKYECGRIIAKDPLGIPIPNCCCVWYAAAFMGIAYTTTILSMDT